jgi:hypothetical protein
MPRGASGRVVNERPGHMVADEALAWLSENRGRRFFLWVHLFEPHAPYGNPSDPAERRRPLQARYDDEVAEADRQAGRVLDVLGADRASTIGFITSFPAFFPFSGRCVMYSVQHISSDLIVHVSSSLIVMIPLHLLFETLAN